MFFKPHQKEDEVDDAVDIESVVGCSKMNYLSLLVAIHFVLSGVGVVPIKTKNFK